MNILLSSVGRRGYIADFFKEVVRDKGKIFGTSNTKWTAGFNHCDENFILPDISSPDYPDAVVSLCREKKVKAVLSFLDQDIDVLANHAELFREHGIATFLPDPATNQICFNKFETYRFFKSKDIDMPLTFSDIGDAKDALARKELFFPLIVKPKYGFGSASLFKARNMRELETFFAYQPEMIIQEFMDGDEYSFDMLFNLHSEVVSVYCKRKLAMRAGETDMAVMKYDERLLRFGKKIGDLLRHAGPMDVDFFITSDGVPKLLELNPRFGGGYPISHACGADFPRKMLAMLNGVEHSFSCEKYDDETIMMKEYAFVNRFSDRIDFSRAGR